MAHSAFKISLLAIFCVSLAAPAEAQNYNYRSGNARVVMGAGGLANPSSSYITGGTMSRSAQAGAGLPVYGGLQPGANTAGITPGSQGSNGLPVARMGSTVGMPGDYMRSDINPNFSYQQQPRQNTQYRNQRRYYNQQQQSNPNAVATYGQAAYARNSSNPTGKQAVQIPTMSAQPQATGGGAAAPAAGGSTATSTYGSTGSGGGFKGY